MILCDILEKLAIENNVSVLEDYEIDYLEQIAKFHYPEMRAVIQLNYDHFIRCDYVEKDRNGIIYKSIDFPGNRFNAYEVDGYVYKMDIADLITEVYQQEDQDYER